MKKIFTILLALIASLGTLYAIVYPGKCGENVDYTLDTESGILRIYGTGDMSNWSGYSDQSNPWFQSYLNQYVERIIIEEGVTNIGNYAFVHFDHVKVLIMNRTTPISNAANSQLSNRNNVKLFVPQGAIDTYQAYDWWKDFGGYFEGGNALVQFVNWNDTVLKEETVRKGLFATKPANNPTRSGYHFTNWNKTDEQLNIIYGPMTVKAQYELGEDTDVSIRFIGKTGSNVLDTTAVIPVPAAPEIDGFTFQKWQVVAGDFNGLIQIQAVYTANDPTSAPQVIVPNPANPAQKLIRDGNVYILTDDKTYTITGQVIK